MSFAKWIFFPPLYDLQIKIYFQEDEKKHQSVTPQCFDKYFQNNHGKIR